MHFKKFSFAVFFKIFSANFLQEFISNVKLMLTKVFNPLKNNRLSF